MSIIMYKQRHSNPNIKKTPKFNYAHIGYIATRPGASKNEGMRHGLFGKLQAGDLQEFDTWQEVAREVRSLSDKKVNMYRGVISFSRETAKELNLLDHKAWEDYIENHIYIMAKENGISLKDFSWCAAHHNEEGHPHAHIMFWDKNQKAPISFVHWKIPNQIRINLIKDTFAEKIEAYIKKKDFIKTEIKEIPDSMIKEFEESIKFLNAKDLTKMRSRSIKPSQLEGLLTETEFVKFAEGLFELRKLMPKGGRLAYQLLPPETKIEVDKFVEKLIANNEYLAFLIKEYIDANIALKLLYETNPDNIDKHKEKVMADAKKLLSNKVLGGIRTIIKKEMELKTEKFEASQKKFYSEQLLMGLLQFFEMKMSEATFDLEENKAINTDLSKLAKKELYLKLKDKGSQSFIEK